LNMIGRVHIERGYPRGRERGEKDKGADVIRKGGPYHSKTQTLCEDARAS